MSFSKFATFCIKSHDWGNEEFLWVPSPDCNTAELRNECFSLFMLSSFYKARANTLPGEPNNGNFRYVNCDFWDRSGTFWKWHCLRKTAIESKRLDQNQWSWCHLVGKRILYAIMDTARLFCPSFSWNHWSYVLHSFWATLYINTYVGTCHTEVS